MDADLYREMMIRDLNNDETFEPVQIPVDPFPGETDDEAAERWMRDEGILYDKDGMTFVDKEKAVAFDPNLFRALRIIFEPELLEALDALEEMGLIVSGMENDEMVYKVTEDGSRYLEDK